jgi:hypothetical protein
MILRYVSSGIGFGSLSEDPHGEAAEGVRGGRAVRRLLVLIPSPLKVSEFGIDGPLFGGTSWHPTFRLRRIDRVHRGTSRCGIIRRIAANRGARAAYTRGGERQ